MDISKINSLTPKVIGEIGVDAGLVWFGDPCYILHKEKLPSTLGNDWGEFCDKLFHNSTKSFNYEMGHEGLGVVCNTKHGDGKYNVIGFFEDDSERPSLVLVDFDNIIDIEKD